MSAFKYFWGKRRILGVDDADIQLTEQERAQNSFERLSEWQSCHVWLNVAVAVVLCFRPNCSMRQ